MKLTEVDALRAYARMMNTLDASHIEPLLEDNFRYSSQWMIGEITSKQEFLDYMKSQLLALKQSDIRAYAEMVIVSAWGHNECVVTAQGEKENLIATVFATVKNGKILRIDMCATPLPSETMRSGEYPS
ncbi:MAG: hypothetical protein Q7T21_00945 [Gallionella sp.]|nr:hypothetical protein [Gallionella sp.]